MCLGVSVSMCILTDVKAWQGSDHLVLDWHVCAAAGSADTSSEASLHNIRIVLHLHLVTVFRQSVCRLGDIIDTI